MRHGHVTVLGGQRTTCGKSVLSSYMWDPGFNLCCQAWTRDFTCQASHQPKTQISSLMSMLSPGIPPFPCLHTWESFVSLKFDYF